MEKFGSRLRQERQRLGMNQATFARLGGVEPNAQSLYESGKRVPRADYLMNIARGGVDLLFLFLQSRRPVISPLIMPQQGLQDVNTSIHQLGLHMASTAQAIHDLVTATLAHESRPEDEEVAEQLKALHSFFQRYVSLALSRISPTGNSVSRHVH